MEVSGYAAEEFVGFAVVDAVFPVAGFGEADHGEEAWVNFGGFVDPVVVASGEAVGGVEEGVQY